MDAEIQAMDGNKSVVQMLDSGDTPKNPIAKRELHCH